MSAVQSRHTEYDFTPFERKARIQKADEGRGVTTRDTKETNHAADSQDVEETFAARKFDTSPKPGRGGNSSRNTALLSSWGTKTTAGVRLSARFRSTFQPTVQKRSSLSNPEEEAGSGEKRPLSASATRFHIRIVHDTKNHEDDGGGREEDLSTMHQRIEPGSQVPTLPTTVFQRTTGGGAAATDVQATNFRSSSKVAQINRNRVEQGFGNLDAAWGNICGSARKSSRADPVPAKRARSGLRCAGVHGSGGPAGAVRDSTRTSALNNNEVEQALVRMIRDAAGYGAAEGGGHSADDRTGARTVGDFLNTAIRRTVQNMFGATALGTRAPQQRSGPSGGLASSPSSNLQLGSKIKAENKRRKISNQEKKCKPSDGEIIAGDVGQRADEPWYGDGGGPAIEPLLFRQSWTRRDEHGEVDRPGLRQHHGEERSENANSESMHEDERDDVRAGGAGAAHRSREPD